MEQLFFSPLGVCSGDVSVGIKCDANMVGDQEADVDFDIIPNANDTFTVKYSPPAAGKMTIKVLFTDKVRARTHTHGEGGTDPLVVSGAGPV